MNEDDFYIVQYDLVLMTANEKINWMNQNSYLPIWLLPLNGLQDGTPYAGRPIGNIPQFIPLDNSINRDILHSLRMHSVFEPLHLRRGGNQRGGKEYVLQLLNTEGNRPRTEA